MATDNQTNNFIEDSKESVLSSLYSGFSIPPIDYGMVFEDYNDPAYKSQSSNSLSNFKPKYSASEIDAKKKKRTISKFFSNMSRLGMTYDEKVIDNMRAIPADQGMLPKEALLGQSMFSQLASKWKQKSNEDQSFFEKDYAIKREALRKLATQPELEDILDTMANESIVYDSTNTYFLQPYIDPGDKKDFKPGVQKEIEDSINNSFSRFYKMLGWKTRAWDDFKRFLIEGILSWEIVYDSLERPKKIIGLIPLDPATLTKKFENNKWYWYQFKGVVGKERKLLDSQIIYIQFQETNCISRLSYLERLIRPFNIYRIIEQAHIIWTVTNASYRLKFTIPVKGMNKAMGSQTLGAAMNRYKEDIKFVQDTGELKINGQVNMPFNKEYWMPESDAGTPQIETIGGDGPELNDNDQLKFFKAQLYKISKIPLDRFDQESGAAWFGTDASSYLRSEISFGRYVDRLRNTFAQIIIKPVILQLGLDIPELQEDRPFLDSVQMEFKSYNEFAELMQLEMMQKRVEFIQQMKESMTDMDTEGNEVTFFASKFLVQKYLHLSDADLKLNAKYKKEEIEELNLAGGDEASYSEEGQ